MPWETYDLRRELGRNLRLHHGKRNLEETVSQAFFNKLHVHMNQNFVPQSPLHHGSIKMSSTAKSDSQTQGTCSKNQKTAASCSIQLLQVKFSQTWYKVHKAVRVFLCTSVDESLNSKRGMTWILSLGWMKEASPPKQVLQREAHRASQKAYCCSGCPLHGKDGSVDMLRAVRWNTYTKSCRVRLNASCWLRKNPR